MTNDNSSAAAGLGLNAEIPTMDRFASMLRDAQLRAAESPRIADPSTDQTPDANQPPPELSQALVGFKYVKLLSEGGQGVVYQYQHTQTGRRIAVKVLRHSYLSSRSERERFEREIQTLAKLQNPNIVAFIPFHNNTKLQFFCMEFIDGPPIDQFVFQHRPGIRKVVEMFVRICDAVQAAHQQLVLHRDLKPANILVTPDDQPHILDFGLSRDLDAEMRGLQDRLSMPEQMVGTLLYSSPEQVDEDFGPVDMRTDVYALGLILYELLGGSKPYPLGGTRKEVCASITSRTPASLRKLIADTPSDKRWTRGTVSDDLERVLLKALEKEKSRRYQSVEAFKEDLLRYLRGDPVTAKSATYGYLLHKFISRHRLGVGLTAGLLIMVLASTATFIKGQRDIARARSAQNTTRMYTLLKSAESANRAEGPVAAIPEYQSALDLATSSDPNDPVARSTTFNASRTLAGIYFDQQNLERGLPYLEIAERIADADYQSNPNDIGSLRQKALIYKCQAQHFTAVAVRNMKPRNDPTYSEAMRSIRENAKASVEIIRKIVALSNGDPAQKLELVDALSFQGGILCTHRKSDESLARLAEASDIVKELLVNEPGNVDYNLSRIEIEHMIAGAHIRFEKPEHDQTALEWIGMSDKHIDELQASRSALYRASELMKFRNANDINRKMVLDRQAKRQADKEAVGKKGASTTPPSS